MPKKTYKQIAEFHGVTRDQVDAAKNKGVNIYNDEDMEEHFANVRHRTKPGTKLSEEVATAQTLEQMEHAIRSATNIDDVKILKEKVLALKGIVAVQTDTRELVPVGEVRQSMTKVVSAARGELLKMSADLPPRVEGLSAPQIQRVIRDSVIEILARLADETSALYAD